MKLTIHRIAAAMLAITALLLATQSFGQSSSSSSGGGGVGSSSGETTKPATIKPGDPNDPNAGPITVTLENGAKVTIPPGVGPVTITDP